MPRIPIDYSKTIMYKLVCKDVNIKDCYVGYTTDFKSRKRGHKKSSKNPSYKQYDYYVYQFIREHGNWENWSMIEIEKYPCNNANEATKQERVWIETLQSTLNCYIPSRTRQEWIEDNKEKLTTQRKEFYEENKDQVLQRNAKYYEAHKDIIDCCCGSKITKYNIKQHEKTKKHIEFINQSNNIIS